MNELASVFLSVFGDESVAYWCFSNFMLYDTYSTSSLTLNTTKIDNAHILKTNVAHYFSDIGMSKKLLHLSELLKQTDIELDEHFKRNGIKNLYFCHEWLLLMFKRCFKSTPAFLRCFEMLASHFLELHTSALKGVSIKSLYSFDLFVCLSLLKQMRHDILERAINEMEIFQVLKENASIFADNYDVTLEYAEEIFEKYCIKMKLKNENEQDSQKSKKKFIIF